MEKSSIDFLKFSRWIGVFLLMLTFALAIPSFAGKENVLTSEEGRRDRSAKPHQTGSNGVRNFGTNSPPLRIYPQTFLIDNHARPDLMLRQMAPVSKKTKACKAMDAPKVYIGGFLK